MESSIEMAEHFDKTENNIFWKAKANTNLNNITKAVVWIHHKIIDEGIISEGSYAQVSFCKIRNCAKLCVTKTLKTLADFKAEKNEIDILVLGATSTYIPDLFYAGFNVDREYIIISEGITGGTLRYHNEKKSRISHDAIKIIAYHIAKGIQFLHDHGYTHGDIKDDNIALTSNGKVRLLDFGFSRKVTTPQILPLQCTPYGAPEVIEQKEASFPSDWWSYGVVLAELIQKKLPFDGSNNDEIKEKVLHDEPDLSGITDDAAKEFIQKLLQKNPNERLTFSSMLAHKFLETKNRHPIYFPANVVKADPSKRKISAQFEQNQGVEDQILSMGYIYGPTSKAIQSFKRNLY